ncbi:hypothetical protein JL108_03120 [Aeromicrobium sp. YIM 150415]|uniref:rhodanese-like domain-containing protein n=1 Tax=Aeromicrobium sp. YIM 150415 TaxID=2803912 RepID=UPI001964E80F|nr:rhodanese-like domain-containing protein [Aeromicrobium sp. YIM 150415]MBM9462425.1 hypothetical protein [Aeromicrobium sp. YIM 150415]
MTTELTTSDLAKEVPLIAADELIAASQDSAPPVIIDVRERGEYVGRQISGAVTVSRGLFDLVIGDVVPEPSTPIVLYCDDGYRSLRAAETASRLGYREVSVLAGGIDAWIAAGGETTYGANVIGKDFGERLAVREEIDELEANAVDDVIRAGGSLIIDSRTPSEYAEGHLPTAVNIAAGEIPAALFALREAGRLPARVVVHCAGRTRSLVGAHIVDRLGIVEHVHALRNGTMAWLMSGRELELESSKAPDNRGGWQEAGRFARALTDEAGIEATAQSELGAVPSHGRSSYTIDVRLTPEYEAGHISGSISIPSGQLANIADEFIGDRHGRIVCVSHDETRARLAAHVLREIGYPRASWLEGGMSAWLEAGRPVETGREQIRHRSYPAVTAARGRVPAVTWADIATGQFVVLDVRRSSEFAVRHVPGSRWVPRGDLERRVGDVIADRSRPIVVVSNRDLRGTLAASTLLRLGYDNVFRLEGGLDGVPDAPSRLVEGLDGADVDLQEAKDDVDLMGERGTILQFDRRDMQQYLDWEINLGEKYKDERRK